jgi:hypothetical protein
MFHNDLYEQHADGSWRLRAKLTGLVSTGNSTDTPLGSGATFTGLFEEIKDYGFFTLSIFTDQDSANDGLKFQWSHDGINVDRTEGTTVAAGIGRVFTLSPRARYFRVQYVNGGTAQGALRLGVVYHSSGSGIITKPLDASVTTENFAQLVQAPVMGREVGSATYQSIGAVQDPSDSAYQLKVVGNQKIIPIPASNVIYQANALLNGSSAEMNINGSSTPVNFDWNPGSGETWYLESISLFIADVGLSSSTNFGGLATLTNGLELRVRSGGTEYLVLSSKSNMDLICQYSADSMIPPAAGYIENSDAYLGTFRFSIPIRVANSTSDYVRGRVRDNLSGLNNLRMYAKIWRTI